MLTEGFSPQTLAFALVFLSATCAITFFIAHRRHPTVPGIAYWSLASLLASLAYAGLGYRLSTGGASLMGFSNSALTASAVLCWLGVRAYLGHPAKLTWVLPALASATVINTVIFNVESLIPWRPAEFLLSAAFISGLTLADVMRLRRSGFNHGEQALLVLTSLELTTVLLVSASLIYNGQTTPLTFESARAPLIIISLFAATLFRLVVYLTLISYALQSQNDTAQHTLRERERQSRELLEHLQAGLVMVDGAGRIRRCNSLGRRLLRTGTWEPAEGEVLSHDLLKCWVNEAEEPLLFQETPHFKVLRQTDPLRDFVFGIRCEQRADTKWLLCSAYATDDRPSLAVLILFDYSGLRQAKARELDLQARHLSAQKMEALGSLASGVAHDFNNILAAILGNTRLLKEDLPHDRDAQETLDQVAKAAGKGRDLVRRILAFGRRQGVTRAPVDVVDLLHDTHSLLTALRAPSIRIECHTPPALPPVLGDLTQLTQVLLNLGTNAVHAVGQNKGTVTLEADVVSHVADAAPTPAAAGAHWWSDDDFIRIRVRDDGCGMDEATKARIFEPFFTTKPVDQGTGLGLAAVVGMVQSHGGTITVDSTPGVGSTFTIMLPVSTSASVTPGQDGNADDRADGSGQSRPAHTEPSDYMGIHI